MISIHAPSRGATIAHCFSSLRCGISIHAPSRGATARGVTDYELLLYFNPRALTGRDEAGEPLLPSADISIHAPSRGATSGSGGFSPVGRFQSTRPHGARPPTNPKFFFNSDFNPRALTGRDRSFRQSISRSRNFNPRALTGRDEIASRRSRDPRHFNPRALTGRDIKLIEAIFQLRISIHAPSRGATSLCPA